MKKILLFGSTGFIGKNLSNYFKLSKKYLLLTPSKIECNLLDLSQVKKVVKETQPDFIINTAYFGGVSSKIIYSDENIFNNIKLVINILRASVNSKQLKKIILFGSGLEYDNSSLSIKETDQIKPKNIYATIKSITSLLSIGLAQELKLPLVLIRPFNLYGPNDKKSVIFYLINSILKNRDFVLTKGEQVRDYLYIDDFTKIIYKIIDNYQKFEDLEIYNASSGKLTQLKTIFKIIFKLCNFEEKYTIIKNSENEYWHQVANIKKIKRLISINKLTSLENGLKNTLDWIKKNYES